MMKVIVLQTTVDRGLSPDALREAEDVLCELYALASKIKKRRKSTIACVAVDFVQEFITDTVSEIDKGLARARTKEL